MGNVIVGALRNGWQGLWNPEVWVYLGEKALAVALILLGIRLTLVLSRPVFDRLFRWPSGPSARRMGRSQSPEALERRYRTLTALSASVVRYVAYFIGAVMILEQLGFKTSSILTAAGIGGLAVGFGAQNLVRDVITGFFILFEDQFAVGDYVAIGTREGIVEEVGLRVTRVRGFGGELYIIPNGQITEVTNYMGPAMRVMFPVEIAYEADVDRAIRVLQALFDELKGTLASLVAGPTVLGVDNLGPSGVQILVWAQAKPMEQWAVARELKRAIKKRLDREGIEIPYPHQTVILRQAAPQAGNPDREGGPQA